MQNPNKPAPRGGNHHHHSKSMGKRKLPDQDIEDREDLLRKQTTITDLFGNGGNSSVSKNGREQFLSPNTKRARRGIPQATTSSSSTPSEPIAVDKMYSFQNKDSKSPARASSGLNNNHSSSSNSYGTSPINSRSSYNAFTRPSNFTPHTGAKRLVVKNLRAVPRLDQDVYFEKIWTQLNSALAFILADKKAQQSLEELYRGAENVCRQGKAPELAKKLQERCNEHVSTDILNSLLERAEDGTDVDILKSVEQAWTTWNARLVTIRSVFYYLDQSFLLHNADNVVIYEMGRVQFRAAVFYNDTLKPRILQGACELIALDRNEGGTAVDPNLLRHAIKLFHDLNVYKKDFEPCMLDASDKYFKRWAAAAAVNCGLATYLGRCHDLIEREMARCDIFALDRSTKQSLSQMLDRYLVSEQTRLLLKEDDVLDLFSKLDQLALEQLYSLLQRLDMGPRLKTAFFRYIDREGSTIVFDQENENKMVTRLLKFKQDLDKTFKEAFHGDQVLGNTIREAFEVFMNKEKKTETTGGDNPKPGEMIAKYVDLLLKGGVKAIQALDGESKSGSAALADEDTEINQKLDQVLELFRFVHGKAVFEAFYKNDLARRLLMGKSASDEAEKSMLARLRSECGSSFTHNLESMFKDMDLARDEMASYNALLDSKPRNQRPPMDLNVNVISAAAWPSYPDVPVNLPEDLSNAMAGFEKFYSDKYNGRKLHWKHSLAHCKLKARFRNEKESRDVEKEIVVSSFQALVLLLFNDSDTLSYTDIRTATGLPDVEIKRTLQSLACAKYKVLTKTPMSREVNEDDIFAYNKKFNDPKMRIKINQIQLKETKQENKITHERVAADRHFETQAAIVRIMKARKVITHGELMAEVINKTISRGKLGVADIKANIEKLIERDYIEREDGNTYRYQA